MLAEFRIDGFLVFLYGAGFTVFRGDDAEYTAYWGLVAVVLIDAAP